MSTISPIQSSLQIQQTRIRDNDLTFKIVKIALLIILSIGCIVINPIIGLLAISIITIFTITNRNMNVFQNTERNPFSLRYWLPIWNGIPRNSNAMRIPVGAYLSTSILRQTTPFAIQSQTRIPVGTSQITHPQLRKTPIITNPPPQRTFIRQTAIPSYQHQPIIPIQEPQRQLIRTTQTKQNIEQQNRVSTGRRG